MVAPRLRPITVGPEDNAISDIPTPQLRHLKPVSTSSVMAGNGGFPGGGGGGIAGDRRACKVTLVQKSGGGRISPFPAGGQAIRRETGMPRPVMMLMTLQATLASVFCVGRVRAWRPRPTSFLYRNIATSANERFP